MAQPSHPNRPGEVSRDPDAKGPRKISSQDQQFAEQLRKLHGVMGGERPQQDPTMNDLRPTVRRMMFDVSLGGHYNEDKRGDVEHLEAEIDNAQAELTQGFEQGKIDRKEYLKELNRLWSAGYARCEKILGRRDFRRLFGGSPKQVISELLAQADRIGGHE